MGTITRPSWALEPQWLHFTALNNISLEGNI